ncbi:MAG TPA: 4'-phosphopantetheinyl transferase superfamily protein [Prolixibacteraceae bacterium]|nr:4'-phosphopantetheinyl transferase superfamily protein [Prolixibacteraceae bacterium]
MNWEKSENIPELKNGDPLHIVYGTHTFTDSLSLEKILTPEELIYSEKLRGEGQKNTWLSCRATLRLILGTYLNKEPMEVEFVKSRFGKLSLVDSNLFFNVSHSSHSFLLGFCTNGRIGVDIEKLSGREDLPALIEYAFSEEEANYCQTGNLTERFAEIWTLKEAFLKAMGIGLVDDLKSITVIGNQQNNISRLKFNHQTFQCPNGETGTIIYRNCKTLRFVWLD